MRKSFTAHLTYSHHACSGLSSADCRKPPRFSRDNLQNSAFRDIPAKLRVPPVPQPLMIPLDKGVIDLLADEADRPGQTKPTVSHQPATEFDWRLRILLLIKVVGHHPTFGSVKHENHLPFVQSIPGKFSWETKNLLETGKLPFQNLMISQDIQNVIPSGFPFQGRPVAPLTLPHSYPSSKSFSSVNPLPFSFA